MLLSEMTSFQASLSTLDIKSGSGFFVQAIISPIRVCQIVLPGADNRRLSPTLALEWYQNWIWSNSGVGCSIPTTVGWNGTFAF